MWETCKIFVISHLLLRAITSKTEKFKPFDKRIYSLFVLANLSNLLVHVKALLIKEVNCLNYNFLIQFQ